ncbi:MAG: methyltransferase domain-containing protein [Dehalococcoidia bacterium]|nr:methyltransferase domain-containing protein [Dehalococcoidia bacterium]
MLQRTPSVLPRLLDRVRAYAGFLGAFVRAHRTIGAIAPTSRGVARRMGVLGGVGRARSIAELGAGTGAITRELLALLPAEGALHAYEVYPPFIEQLRASVRDPRFTLVAESAEALPAASSTPGAGGFDAVVSSLPFSLMGPELTHAILRASGEALRPGGVFVALQYHPTYLLPFLRQHFGSVERHFNLLNLPPVLLLRARDPLPTPASRV